MRIFIDLTILNKFKFLERGDKGRHLVEMANKFTFIAVIFKPRYSSRRGTCMVLQKFSSCTGFGIKQISPGGIGPDRGFSPESPAFTRVVRWAEN